MVRMQVYARELIDLKPDLILVSNTPSAKAVLDNTRTIPVLFVNVTDPIGSGLVSSLASPGRNTTGFTNFEFTMGGKWLQLLKQIAPSMKRAALLFNPALAPFAEGYIRSFTVAATSLSVEPILAPKQPSCSGLVCLLPPAADITPLRQPITSVAQCDGVRRICEATGRCRTAA
jgi:putative tryptophan/tyrosine transport system substrate-binding protein